MAAFRDAMTGSRRRRSTTRSCLRRWGLITELRVMAASGSSLGKQFAHRVPVVSPPALRQVFGVAFWKCRVIEHDLGAAVEFGEFESNDRVEAAIPTAHSPGLNNQLVRP